MWVVGPGFAAPGFAAPGFAAPGCYVAAVEGHFHFRWVRFEEHFRENELDSGPEVAGALLCPLLELVEHSVHPIDSRCRQLPLHWSFSAFSRAWTLDMHLVTHLTLYICVLECKRKGNLSSKALRCNDAESKAKRSVVMMKEGFKKKKKGDTHYNASFVRNVLGHVQFLIT